MTPQASPMFKILHSACCEHCGATTNTYRRYFHAEMMDFLCCLGHLGSGIHHTREIYPTAAKASTDGAYLRHWGLITKHGTGMYRLTECGRAFLDGTVAVPRWIDFKHGKYIKHSDATVQMIKKVYA